MSIDAIRNGYVLSTDKSRIDVPTVHAFMQDSYWAADRPMSTLRLAIDNSICFGIYKDRNQVGFARVVTDGATFAWLCDVYIAHAHRGLGLSTWLMEGILAHPDLQNLQRWLLATKDSHGLYERYGFSAPHKPERLMERYDESAYRRSPNLGD